MERLNRRTFLKGATAVSLGSLLGAIGQFVALPGQAQASPATQQPLPDDVVVGKIREKWISLGGRQGFGAPLTPERPTPDGVGRYNHFDRNRSIYWHPDTGACAVEGEIRDRWAQIGWERSWLGYPVSDELTFTEGGRVSSFQRGQIYWWPDTGAMELKGVVVHYTGLHYRDEMNSDQLSNSDEPYAIIGVISPDGHSVKRTKIYKDVDRRESRKDRIELYRGKPRGLSLSVLLMEHDYGEPDDYKKTMEEAVRGGFAGITALITLIPKVGPVIAATAGRILQAVAPHVSKALSKLLDLGDDKIGETTLVMTAKEMVVLAARTEPSVSEGVEYKRETEMIRGGGAKAKLAFNVEPA